MKTIISFNPTKAHIQKIIERVKSFSIKGIDDKEGYSIVKKAKKELGDCRIKITKYGKSKRVEAIAIQREVLRQEKELLSLITPTENKFKKELQAIDQAKERKEREILLPSRKKLVESVGGGLTDEDILDMNEKMFAEVYKEMKTDFDEAQRIKKENERLEKKRLKDLEKAKEQARAEAKIEAERERKEAIANERLKAKRAKQKIIDDQKRKEQERLEAEAEAKRQAEAEAKAEKKRQEKLEADKKFQKFLKDNKYDENTDILQRDEKEVRLYRLVNTFKK